MTAENAYTFENKTYRDTYRHTTSHILAHAIHSVPYMALMTLTRLNSMPKNLTEAARDLGADSFVTFIRVTIPYLSPALIGGTVFSMLSSFWDIADPAVIVTSYST